ncbi:MAG TPA: aminopeptidase N, partial [Tepidiformaceae bacterium]
EVTIRFTTHGTGDTFLDFRGMRIDAFEVNGEDIEPQWTGFRLAIPEGTLRETNSIHIRYENLYDHTGDGLHQFVDPEDGEEYLYTNFEPYEAHRLFPCFDQPDIKATYELTVTAPSEWAIIANSREVASEDTGSGRTRRRFETTEKFSPYLFAMIAGPYHSVLEMHGDIQLGLFCRKSLAPYLDSDEVFTVTRQGLDFYADFFDYPYPFGKYDQVFVPEFNSGAMENVAAVTHNEFMVHRDPPTDTQRRERAEVVLHEMAHMWFGNLVTMRWWNDLWLNESFATYMAYLALEKATRFDSGWQDFNASVKNWAYRQDQLVTTHPIAGRVADTDETFLNFDGITYGKGASVLKQLVAAIGIEGFREGMRQYFKRYAFGNATLEQFMAALEAGSGRRLAEWSRLWLETPSLNTVSAHIEHDGERVKRLTVQQTAPDEFPTLRPHYLEVALLHEGEGGLSTIVVPAEISSAETEVPGTAGSPRPLLAFPNAGDHGYAKVALDDDSVAFARANMERIEDPLLRQLLWSSLWNMVRDQQLKSTDYLEVVRNKVQVEQRLDLVEAILGHAAAALGRFVPDSLRDEEAHRLFLAAWSGLDAAPQGDAQITWARALIGAAVIPDDLALVGQLADGTQQVEGLNVDQDMRWAIAIRWMAFGMPGGEDRLRAESERDPSDRGQRARLRGETSAPSTEVKAGAWERFHGEGYGSLKLTTAAMSGFNWQHQRDILEPYVERFFAGVVDVFRSSEDKEFQSDYFASLFPGYRVETSILERSQQVLATVPDELPLLRRMLREANDDLARAIRCRAFAES